MAQVSAFLCETLEISGKELKNRFGRPLKISQKEDSSLVTDADLEVEQIILKRLRKAFPKDYVLSEESGDMCPLPDRSKRIAGNYVWIIDPLDGTTNFVHHYPFYCVSIARGVIQENGSIKIKWGGIYEPMMDRIYFASKGKGAFCNNSPMSTSTASILGESFVSMGMHNQNSQGKKVENLYRLASSFKSVRRDGSAALDLAYVANGVFDCFVEFSLRTWDVAAGALLITEAGGSVQPIARRDPESKVSDFFDIEGGNIVAGSQELVHNLKEKYYKTYK